MNNDLMIEEINRTLEVLKRGGIILYPTDTVWGIGCDARNESAVAKIYELKQRSDSKSMLVLLDKIDKVSLYIKRVPDVAWELFELADKPLTIILSDASGVAENLLPEEKTLGIRIPNNEFCQKLIYRLGGPLVSTSANISGQPAPKTFSEISDVIKNGVDYVVDPKIDKKSTHSASSIIKLDASGCVEIIRK